MKTPDEIKKALKLCGRGCYSGCPYKSFECVEELSRDALAYIKQLEARIDTLTAKAVLFDEAVAAGEKYKRERDAAVEDIFHMCANCKHEKLGYGVGPCPPIEEYLTNDCSNWQWRGVQEGE